jgi:ribosomal protein S6--L-glutamate ligase
MRTIVTLVSGFGWHVHDLRRAAETLRIALKPIAFPKLTADVARASTRVLAGEIDLTATDGVLVRMMPPGTLEQVVFRMDALHRVVAAGVPVFNPPGAIEAAVDKYLALARLDAKQLPVPPTWVGESAAEALKAFDALGRDVVIKPLFGSEGRGLCRVTDREVARRVAFTLERLGAVLYVQKYIPHQGHDYRLFVLDNRVVAAMRRYAPTDEWRTNVAVGGRAEAFRPEPALTDLALRSASAVGARMAGIDLLPDADGNIHVLEVNAVPGWRALAAATGIDVATEILSAMSNELRRE